MSLGTLRRALLISYISVASISAVLITPALPLIAKSFVLSRSALNYLMSVFLLGYVLGQLIYGPLANRIGRLNSLRLGLVVNLIGILLCLLAVFWHQYYLLLLGRGISALGAASGLCCTFILINELLNPKEAAHLSAYAVISFTLGTGVAVFIGGLVAQYISWQACFVVLFVHGLMMLLLTYLFSEPKVTTKAINLGAIIHDFKTAFRSTKLCVFSIMLAFVSVFTYCYAVSAPIYATKVLEMTPSDYGLWNGFNVFGMLLGGIASAKLIRRCGPRQVLKMGLWALTPTLVLLLMISLTHSQLPLLFFSTTMFLNIYAGFVFPTASFFAVNAIQDRASASSAMSFINMGSAMLAVIILGYIPLSAIISFSLILSVFFVVVLILYFAKGKWLIDSEQLTHY